MRCLTGILRLTLAVFFILTFLFFPYYTAAQGTRPEADWAGTWSTRWTIMQYGQMKTYEFDLVISQSGNQITGSSSYYNWAISGIASGNNFEGRWSNKMSAQEAGHVFGPVKLTLDSAGRSFSGQFIGEYHYGVWDPRFTVTGYRAGTSPAQPVIPQPTYNPPLNPQPTGQTSPTLSKQFTGKWNTDFGEMVLKQDGDKLTGTYYGQDGNITGTVSGDTATGTWSESPSFQPPWKAGDFIFTLSGDGTAIKGKWRWGTCGWDGDIRGTRKDQSVNPLPPGPVQPVPSGAWTGKWDTGHNGLMTLTQTGNSVTGVYEHEGGRITGIVSGNVFTGTWSEAPSYRPPDDAGDMEFTLAADGKSFTGRWRYDSSGNWYTSWNGSLISQVQTAAVTQGSCDWTGTWTSSWSPEMKLQQSGSQVNGTYIPGGWTYTATISGTASGNILSGIWTEKERSGRFEWTLLADCNSYTGRYNHNTSSSTLGYNLQGIGRRVSPAQSLPDTAPQAPVPVNLDWSGEWETDWGTMIIKQTNNLAGGSYTYNDGHLWGPVSGNRMYGLWSTAPSYLPPKNQGWYEFTMSQDKMSFEGNWRYDCPWTDDWDGTLIPDAGPAPLPNQKPVAQFTVIPQSPTTADSIVISSQSYDPDGDSLSYTWAVDGYQLTQYKDKLYCVMPGQAAGNHSAMLTVTDSKGNVSTSQSNYFVNSATPPTPPQPVPGSNKPPVAYFTVTPQSPQTTSNIVASSQSSDPDGDTLTHAWTIDGTAAPQYANLLYMVYQNPVAGSHTIGLQVSDSQGATTYYQQQVIVTQGQQPQPGPGPQPVPGVNNPPKAYFSFNPPQPEAGDNIQVSSQATDPDGDDLNYAWSLDNQPLTQYTGQPSWTWKNAKAGGHFIHLEVTDGRGGSNGCSRKINIPGDDTQQPDTGKKKWKIGPLSCFIATAAYGSETAEELYTLRAFRDRVLVHSGPGRWFVNTYYNVSPPLAEFIADKDWLRAIVRLELLDPIILILKGSQQVWNK